MSVFGMIVYASFAAAVFLRGLRNYFKIMMSDSPGIHPTGVFICGSVFILSHGKV